MVLKFTKYLIHEWIHSPMDYYEVVIGNIFEGSVFSFSFSYSFPLSQWHGHYATGMLSAMLLCITIHRPRNQWAIGWNLWMLTSLSCFFRYFVSGMKSDQRRFPQSARILIHGCCAVFTRWLFFMIHKHCCSPSLYLSSRQEDDFYSPK